VPVFRLFMTENTVNKWAAFWGCLVTMRCFKMQFRVRFPLLLPLPLLLTLPLLLSLIYPAPSPHFFDLPPWPAAFASTRHLYRF
jgi:hypothetical protein